RWLHLAVGRKRLDTFFRETNREISLFSKRPLGRAPGGQGRSELEPASTEIFPQPSGRPPPTTRTRPSAPIAMLTGGSSFCGRRTSSSRARVEPASPRAETTSQIETRPSCPAVKRRF